jgi:hypothetical protein
MSGSPPLKVAIDHDEYTASHIGHTADGKQFFLTTPFVPAMGEEPGREFLALYLFDGQGKLIEARIDDLGTRANLDRQQVKRLHQERLEELGRIELGRIEVQPFQLNRFGTVFGFVLRPPGEDIDVWCVEVEPGNYMAFFEPWDSGR